jgi:hypothetical protein
VSRYELCCPPVREWPARGKANFLALYDTAMDRVLPWRWMCSAIFMPGSPSHTALVDLREATAAGRESTAHSAG